MRRYLVYLSALVLGYLLVSLALETLSSRFPSLRLSTNVWGTYGDWAAAILPTFAILLSVDMWMTDRRRAGQARLLARVDGVQLSQRQGGQCWMYNGSVSELIDISTNCTDITLSSRVLKPGGDIQVGWEAQRILVAFRTPEGTRWTASLTGLASAPEQGRRDS